MRLPEQHITTPLATALSQPVSLLMQLVRARLAALVALSGLAGYLFASRSWDLLGLQVSLAVLLLASGCSALNQWQERSIDARMERTCNRPLPAGLLQPRQVLLLAATMIAGGLLLLAPLPGRLPILLGGFAVLWYNGLYTGLKRISAYAVLPGAVCGALPPLIGWSAAGEGPLAFPAITLAGTLFLWQMPHFWLLACCHRADHARSGLPNLFKRFDHGQMFRINNFWLFALGLSYLLFPLFGMIHSRTLSTLFLVGLSLLAFLTFRESGKGPQALSHRRLFHLVNLSMLWLLATLLLDSL